MNKFYAIALFAAACTLPAAATPNRFAKKLSAKKTATAATLVEQSSAADKIFKPTKSSDYIYEEGEWILMGETTFGYDSRGNITTKTVNEDGYITETTFTYNDDNMETSHVVTEGEEDGPMEKSSKRTYVYDPVVKNFYIERMGYDWNGLSWDANFYCEKNTITRNSDGYITEIMKELPMAGTMTPAYKSCWSYDATTGQANEFAYYEMRDPSLINWTLYNNTSYKEIEWDRTNGQMTSGIEELTEGENRIKSAAVYYDGILDGYMFVSYSGENDYTIKSTFNDPTVVGEEIIRETTDENGSYKITDNFYVDEDGNPSQEVTITVIESVTIDSHGNVTEARMDAYIFGELDSYDINRNENTYDEDGNIIEVISYILDPEEEDMMPEMRSVYSGYIDVAETSGIADIATDNKNALIEVYNINGVRVSDNIEGLDSGFYIVRQGNKASKISVK